MAITVKHKFVSAIPDAGDPTIVQPSNWNDDHTLVGLGTMAEQNANNVNITGGTITGISGIGDVVGPSSSTDNAVARFDTTTGKLIQNSGVTIDDNSNITANALDDGYLNTAASGTPIVLTSASVRRYTITGSGGQTIKLPNATTLSNGTVFQFDNNQSSGAITVNNNSNTLVVSVPSGGFVLVNLLSNATAAGSWDRHDQAPANVSWSTNTFDYAGSITSATWNGNAVAINRGGTGQTTASTAFNALSPLTTAGDTLYGGTSGAGTRLAIGTAGQVLTVNAGATAPQWSTPTTGTVTSVSGTSPINVATGTTTPAISLATAYGDTQNPYASKTANYFLAAPNGSAGSPTFRAMVAADVPTLNQNTTGSAATLTTGRTISITGDLAYTSPSFDGSTNVTATGTLATVNSNVGTYTKITINGKGLATAGSQASLSDLSSPTSSFSFGSQLLTNLLDPVSAQDAATKLYVDNVAQGLDAKASCVCGTTVNITLSGTQTIDGIAVVAGDRVLVKNQSAAADNGIYVASASAWSRAADMNTWAEVPNSFTFLEGGTTQSDTGWVCTSAQGGTLGVTAINWTQFSGAGTYTAGTGLTLTGTQFSIDSTVATLTDSQTLTNKTISGASNTLSNIGNSSLSNSSITINGSAISLGGSVSVGTVTSVSGTGSVNGITLTGTVTSSGSLTLGGTLGSIANSQLTNSAITINGTSISLGASGTITATATNALTIGTYLTGTSYNGSTAVTIAADATSTNTASKLVARDSNGDFSAGTITATKYVGVSGGTF